MPERVVREDGAVLLDGIQAGTTQRCPHCSGHFLVAAHGHLSDARKELGNVAHPRAWCSRCGRQTCGRPCCDPVVACIPIEARLEHAEGRKTNYDDLIKQLEREGAVLL